MPTPTETEKWAEWVYLKKGWTTDRAQKVSSRLPNGVWISKRNDRFGMFDLIAICPWDGHVDLIQVTKGAKALSNKKSLIKKWWKDNNFKHESLNLLGVGLFFYVGKPRKHFQTWYLFYELDKLKWYQGIDLPIPKKEEVIK